MIDFIPKQKRNIIGLSSSYKKSRTEIPVWLIVKTLKVNRRTVYVWLNNGRMKSKRFRDVIEFIVNSKYVERFKV